MGAIFQVKERGVTLVGPIPNVIPPFSLPPAFDITALGDLFMPALAIALLGTVESLAIGKQMAAIKGDSFDGSQELIGQGLGNIAAGLTSGIPGCGSFTRSALVVTSGGNTRMGTVYSGLLALPMLFVLAPLMSWLPMPALGGVLLLISFQMIDRESIRLCLVATRIDRAVLLLTFAATLILDLERPFSWACCSRWCSSSAKPRTRACSGCGPKTPCCATRRRTCRPASRSTLLKAPSFSGPSMNWNASSTRRTANPPVWSCCI